jgi:hypothetical protein
MSKSKKKDGQAILTIPKAVAPSSDMLPEVNDKG